jgi:AraC-like DNA-binding protein
MTPFHIKTIAEYHRLMALPKPEHPLISILKFEDMQILSGDKPNSISHYFYSIALKKNASGKMKYGQESFDFDEGMMHFMSPKQVLSYENTPKEALNHSGWLLLIHPDFLWNTPLAKKIKQYDYFTYNVNEALHLSDKEEKMVTGIIQNIAQEYHSNIDKFTQEVIIAQLELLLTYAERFYQRQFITRKINNHTILNQLEDFLNDYFSGNAITDKGLPTVQAIAEHFNMSPNYLGSLLKQLTGQSTQQHIHDKLIEKAKEQLSTTHISISEIAYALGFEHSQSFSKLFKTKTSQSPFAFRQSFN